MWGTATSQTDPAANARLLPGAAAGRGPPPAINRRRLDGGPASAAGSLPPACGRQIGVSDEQDADISTPLACSWVPAQVPVTPQRVGVAARHARVHMRNIIVPQRAAARTLVANKHGSRLIECVPGGRPEISTMVRLPAFSSQGYKRTSTSRVARRRRRYAHLEVLPAAPVLLLLRTLLLPVLEAHACMTALPP